MTHVGFFEIATSGNKTPVDIPRLHENRNEIFGDYTKVFEMAGDFVIGEQKQTTAMRFKNIEHYKSYIENLDID